MRRASKSPRNLVPASKRSHIQSEDLDVAKDLGDLPAINLQGQSFSDGGFADAGIAHKDRVVLGPPPKDLQGSEDLVFAPDERIDQPVRGLLDEVDREAFESAGFSRFRLAVRGWSRATVGCRIRPRRGLPLWKCREKCN